MENPPPVESVLVVRVNPPKSVTWIGIPEKSPVPVPEVIEFASDRMAALFRVTPSMDTLIPAMGNDPTIKSAWAPPMAATQKVTRHSSTRSALGFISVPPSPESCNSARAIGYTVVGLDWGASEGNCKNIIAHYVCLSSFLQC